MHFVRKKGGLFKELKTSESGKPRAEDILSLNQ